jgi:hypothetical protein
MLIIILFCFTGLADIGSSPPLRYDDLAGEQFLILTNDGKVYKFTLHPEQLMWVSDLGTTLNEIREGDRSQPFKNIKPDMEGGFYYYPRMEATPIRVYRD